jgi:hypothetical protein
MKSILALTAAILFCAEQLVIAQEATSPRIENRPRSGSQELLDHATLVIMKQRADETVQLAERKRQSELAEDMEILAEIIRESVGAQFAPAYRVEFDPHTHVLGLFWDRLRHPKHLNDPHTAPKHGEVSKPLAEYLPGHGMVIQLRVPAPRTASVKAEGEKEAETTSRWEQTRKRLQGDPTAQPGSLSNEQCAQCHTGLNDLSQYLPLSAKGPRPTKSGLVQAVVTTLAENGHNVRGLAEGERVTVSLNYWQQDEPPSNSDAPARQEGGQPGAEDGSKPPSEKHSGQPPKSGADADDSRATAKALSEFAARQSKGDEGGAQPHLPNSIDRLILEQWLKSGGSGSSDVSRADLIRRTYLDLLGVPPTAAQVRDFLSDDSPNAYDRLVDRLLKADDYRETVRRHWLDLAKQSAAARAGSPLRSRISISATREQLLQVARQEMSELDFLRQVQIRVFEP